MKFQLQSGSLVALFDRPDDAIPGPMSSDRSVGELLLTALQNPLELPRLSECVVPGDRVAIVVDPETPDVIAIITQVWEKFQSGHGDELDATLLFPVDPSGNHWNKLLEELPLHVRNQVAVHVHDPDDETQRSYLANSAAGDRLYLSHYVADADLIVTVGVIGFDNRLGYRGTTSAIYPALSDALTIAEARKLGHADRQPDAKHPLRDLIDEIGWLLGTQFAVQIVPDSNGQITGAFCGSPEQVTKVGRESLNHRWRISVDEPSELVVVSIPGPAHNAWKQLGAALETATTIVADGGRIVVVADLPATFGDGMEMLRRVNDSGDVLEPMRQQPTDDATEVTQLVRALEHASVFVWSNLDAAVIEDLGMQPLANESEFQRSVANSGSVSVLADANYAFATVSQVSPT